MMWFHTFLLSFGAGGIACIRALLQKKGEPVTGKPFTTPRQLISFPCSYYEPTVVVKTAPEHRIIREEVFGPVVAATHFDSVEEVVSAAKDTV